MRYAPHLSHILHISSQSIKSSGCVKSQEKKPLLYKRSEGPRDNIAIVLSTLSSQSKNTSPPNDPPSTDCAYIYTSNIRPRPVPDLNYIRWSSSAACASIYTNNISPRPVADLNYIRCSSSAACASIYTSNISPRPVADLNYIRWSSSPACASTYTSNIRPRPVADLNYIRCSSSAGAH